MILLIANGGLMLDVWSVTSLLRLVEKNCKKTLERETETKRDGDGDRDRQTERQKRSQREREREREQSPVHTCTHGHRGTCNRTTINAGLLQSARADSSPRKHHRHPKQNNNNNKHPLRLLAHPHQAQRPAADVSNDFHIHHVSTGC